MIIDQVSYPSVQVLAGRWRGDSQVEQELLLGFKNFTDYWKRQNTSDGDKEMCVSKRKRGVLTEDSLRSL